LNSLEVSRLELVRAFGNDTLPAQKLALQPATRRRFAKQPCQLADLPAPERRAPTREALLRVDWLHGFFTAANLRKRWARARRTTDEAIYMSERPHRRPQREPVCQDSGQAIAGQPIAGNRRISKTFADPITSSRKKRAFGAGAAEVRMHRCVTQRLVLAYGAGGQTVDRAHELQVEDAPDQLALAEQTRAAASRSHRPYSPG
jgi:chromosome segregation protein